MNEKVQGLHGNATQEFYLAGPTLQRSEMPLFETRKSDCVGARSARERGDSIRNGGIYVLRHGPDSSMVPLFG
jgi:hypothetical protein